MSLTFDTFEALQPILQCIPHMIFAIDVRVQNKHR